MVSMSYTLNLLPWLPPVALTGASACLLTPQYAPQIRPIAVSLGLTHMTLWHSVYDRMETPLWGQTRSWDLLGSMKWTEASPYRAFFLFLLAWCPESVGTLMVPKWCTEPSCLPLDLLGHMGWTWHNLWFLNLLGISLLDFDAVAAMASFSLILPFSFPFRFLWHSGPKRTLWNQKSEASWQEFSL